MEPLCNSRAVHVQWERLSLNHLKPFISTECQNRKVSGHLTSASLTWQLWKFPCTSICSNDVPYHITKWQVKHQKTIFPIAMRLPYPSQSSQCLLLLPGFRACQCHEASSLWRANWCWRHPGSRGPWPRWRVAWPRWSWGFFRFGVN